MVNLKDSMRICLFLGYFLNIAVANIAGGFDSCSLQNDCIVIDVAEEGENGCGGTCTYKICVTLNLAIDNDQCAKSGSVSHLCLAEGDIFANICDADTAGWTTIESGTGNDSLRESGGQHCQTVAPGEVATFVLKDGAQCGDSFSTTTSFGDAVSCVPSEEQYCSGSGNIGKECVWTVTPPSSCGETPTDPPTDPPTNPPTDPPTNPPTNPPTDPPTNPPTNPPTDPPTNPPTDPGATNSPTDPPTNPPTDPPTDPPAPQPTAEPEPDSTPQPTAEPTGDDSDCDEDNGDGGHHGHHGHDSRDDDGDRDGDSLNGTRTNDRDSHDGHHNDHHDSHDHSHHGGCRGSDDRDHGHHGGGHCFSSMATVDVEIKGKTFVSNLQVGDMVLTGANGYRPIYTIDHKDPNKRVKFVQIYSTANPKSPLEMTEAHMVFVDGKEDPIPASTVKVGDALQTVDGDSPSIVTNISFIERKGLWNPITSDGTIVVDGIVASTYNIAFGINDGADVEVAGVKVMSHHDFLHLFMSPYRAVCLGLSLSLCETQNNFNGYSQLGNRILKLRYNQSKVSQGLMVAIAVQIAYVFKFLSFVTNPLVVLGVMVGVGAYRRVLKKKN